MMEPVTGPFRDLLRTVALRPPQIPYVSNVTGTWVTAAEATDPEHWVRHLRQTVRFADGVGELWREPGRVLLEVGPGQTLGSLALQSPASAGAAVPVALPSLRHEHDRQDDQAFLLRTLGQLWLYGVEADPAAFWAGERRRRLPLPTYPYERQRYWLDRQEVRRAPAAAAAPDTGRIADMADWFHVPSWRLAFRPPEPTPARDGLWLVLADGAGLGTDLAHRLAAAGRRVAVAHAGDGFAKTGEGSYRLKPGRSADFDALLADLGEAPQTIVHLWTVTGGERSADFHDTAFHSLVALAQSLGKRGTSTEAAICAVTDGLCAVERGDLVQPEKALLLGPVRVITQEYPRPRGGAPRRDRERLERAGGRAAR